MTPDPGQPSDLARAIQDVSERTSVLIREEIELAKAEVTQKVSKLARGAAIGAAAGIFAAFGLIYLFHSLSWLVWRLLPVGGGEVWLGYGIVAIFLFVLGGLAGFIAARLIKKGSPPTPAMAIEEAQLIRETISGDRPAIDSGRAS